MCSAKQCVLPIAANTCRALMRHKHLTFIHTKGADIRALCREGAEEVRV